MSKTYVTMYEDEIRAVELAITDQDDTEYPPTTAYAMVVDNEGAVVVAEAAAMVIDNGIYTLIGTAVTSVPGDYEIIWRILKTIESPSTTYTFYHKTLLTVEAL